MAKENTEEQPSQENSKPTNTDSNDGKITFGLGLGGGAVRGAAHLGILKALEDQGLRPDYLSGTSIGALIGGLYAFGVGPEAIRDLAAEKRWFDLSGFTLPKFGLLSNEEIRRFVEKQLGPVNIEDSQIPLAIMTTDLVTGEKVVLKEGSLSKAVMASTCIPGLFTPVPYGDRMLVDGVLVENVPITPLKAMGADIVVGVNLDGDSKGQPLEGITDVLLTAFEIAINSSMEIYLQEADLVVRVPLSHYSRTDFSQIWELYAEGYRSGMLTIKDLRNEMKKRTPSSLTILRKQLKQWRES